MKTVAEFKTKTALTEYTKNAINATGLCYSLKTKNISLYTFLLDLFSRHPEYPNKISNMIDIFIDRNKMNPSYFALYIRRADGTSEDISWRCCVDGKAKDGLNAAMRAAVSDQIIVFKNSHEFCCEICNCRDGTSKDFHVDHILPFRDIKKNFLELHPNRPKIFGSNQYYLACFRAEDKEYEELWTAYHKKHATLRILCAKCNLTRPRNDSDSE